MQTTWFACRSKIASSECCFTPQSASGWSCSDTSSGPRRRKSIRERLYDSHRPYLHHPAEQMRVAQVIRGRRRRVPSPADVEAILASDQEREYTVSVLRRHWLAGRLTAEEFEQRVAEVVHARFVADLWHALRFLPVDAPFIPRRRGGGSAVASLVTGVMAIFILMVSFGLLFIVALPLAVTAWALGRDARRSGNPQRYSMARAGEVLGIVGTAFSLLLLAGCAAFLGVI
jgi:uncharacterized protein DUF1707